MSNQSFKHSSAKYFLLAAALLLVQLNAQTPLNMYSSCSQQHQVAFHPTDPNKFALPCNAYTSEIQIFSIAGDTITAGATFVNAQGTTVKGLKFSPVNGQYLLSALNNYEVTLLTYIGSTITKVSAVSTNFQTLYNLDVNPSGTKVAVAASGNSINYMTIGTNTLTFVSTTTITQGSLCKSTIFVSDSLLLVGCDALSVNPGIALFAVTPTSVTYQSNIFVSGGSSSVSAIDISSLKSIAFKSGSYQEGFFTTGFMSNLFRFTLDSTSSPTKFSSVCKVLTCSSCWDATSVGVNAGNTRLVATVEDTITTNKIALYDFNAIKSCSVLSLNATLVGLIVGVVVGVVVGVAIIAAIIYFVFCRSKPAVVQQNQGNDTVVVVTTQQQQVPQPMYGQQPMYAQQPAYGYAQPQAQVNIVKI